MTNATSSRSYELGDSGQLIAIVGPSLKPLYSGEDGIIVA